MYPIFIALCLTLCGPLYAAIGLSNAASSTDFLYCDGKCEHLHNSKSLIMEFINVAVNSKNNTKSRTYNVTHTVREGIFLTTLQNGVHKHIRPADSTNPATINNPIETNWEKHYKVFTPVTITAMVAIPAGLLITLLVIRNHNNTKKPNSVLAKT